MCIGPFGGAKSDIVCVQSCDSMLMIYEIQQFQCMCQLSTEYFPLPGALSYNPQIDAFVIQNSAYELECYKYSNIVAVA
jgi:Bardet-Biedl syndrome 9 protein